MEAADPSIMGRYKHTMHLEQLHDVEGSRRRTLKAYITEVSSQRKGKS